jgi:hypothetical protein
MKLRVGITIIALIVYVGLFDLYIFEFLNWSPYFDKLFYNWLTFGTWLFVLLDWKTGFVNEHHKCFNFLIFLSLLVNYLFIILTVTEFFNTKHPLNMFYAYDTTILVITCTIFYNEIKYKIMSD